MTGRKTIFYINVDTEKSAAVWSFLTENFEVIVDKMQHSVDEKD